MPADWGKHLPVPVAVVRQARQRRDIRVSKVSQETAAAGSPDFVGTKSACPSGLSAQQTGVNTFRCR